MTYVASVEQVSTHRLPIERYFDQPALSGPQIGALAWAPEGKLLAYTRAGAENPDCFDLWVCEPREGAMPRRLLEGTGLGMLDGLSNEERARRERQRQFASGVGRFSWKPKGDSILAEGSSGALLVDIETGSTCSIIGPEATDLQLAPQQDRLAYVVDGEIWVASLEGEETWRLTPKSDEQHLYGVAEFVAQEEFARDTGYWWAPDGQSIAFTCVDESDVTLAQVITTSAAGTQVHERRFPKAGTRNARVSLFVSQLDQSTPIEIGLGGDEDFYLLRVAWSKDSKTLLIQRQSRDQRSLDLIAADPQTGATKIIHRDEGCPWINPNLDFHMLEDGGFLWVSERDGTNQLYRHDASGAVIEQLTKSPILIASRDREAGLVGVDETSGLAFVQSGRGNALERHLFRVPLNGQGECTQITQAEGWWNTKVAPGAKHFAAVYSSPSQPPRCSIYDIDGSTVCDLEPNRVEENDTLQACLSADPESEFGQLIADDGQSLDYILRRPSGFDPSQRYPAILYVYGGPGRQHVKKSWRPLEERAYLDAGFVILQLDNRGACGRGLSFEAPILGCLGKHEVEDQLRAISFLRSLDFVRSDSIGVMGWSYGGFMTLQLLCDRRSGLKAGIAGGSIAYWKDYDTHYTERYLGKPQDDPASYEMASVIPKLAELRGRLMLVHGMADDNVLLDHAVEIMSELQRRGTSFDLMLYPGQGHVLVGQDVRTHCLRTYLDFFERELKQDA